jgi:hypothetical protein
MKKLTPIVFVEAIEPCLPFWTERLGFEAGVQVPHGDALGFVILTRDGAELMYQTFASLSDDLPALTDEVAGSTTTLFLEVDGGLDPVVEALEGVEHLVPRRTTFYGMDEIFVRAPCGTLVGFAARVDTAS